MRDIGQLARINIVEMVVPRGVRVVETPLGVDDDFGDEPALAEVALDTLLPRARSCSMI